MELYLSAIYSHNYSEIAKNNSWLREYIDTSLAQRYIDKKDDLYLNILWEMSIECLLTCKLIYSIFMIIHIK